MKAKLPMIPRILLGLIFVIFGLNGFLQFIPMPPLPDAAGAFLGALAASGYMFPLIKVTEILCGISFLTGKLSALGLVILAPISINILMFHAILTPGISNLVMPVLIVVLHFAAAKEQWPKFQALLKF